MEKFQTDFLGTPFPANPRSKILIVKIIKEFNSTNKANSDKMRNENGMK